jgi:hypothetical protein
MLPESQRSTLDRRIAEAARGNYLYAKYMVQAVVSEPDQVHDLDGLALPSGLDGVYRSFLKRELGRSIERWNEAFRPLLGVIAEAHGDGLTLTQLAGITGSLRSVTANRLQGLSQFLYGQLPDGPFRFFHKSFRDFLIGDTEFNIYPSEVNGSIADFFMNEYHDDWINCEDQYALRYTLQHLIDAFMSSNERQVYRSVMAKLIQLLTDQSYVEAKTKVFGRNALLSEAERVFQMVSKKVGTGREETQKLAQILDTMRREIHP